MLVDSHCHLNFDELSAQIPELLANCQAADVNHLLVVSVNLEAYPQVQAMMALGPGMSISCGVHPCYFDSREPTLDELIALGASSDVVAIGETGLDYLYAKTDEQIAMQNRRFVTHIDAAKALKKPLIIHTRAAAAQTMTLLENHQAQQCGGVMHCFSEDWDIAKRALDLGFYLSFSGILTFKNATQVHDVARRVPLDRVLFETDSPYLAPVPYRGKRNQPAYVRHTAEHFCTLRGLDIDTVERASTHNFFTLFSAAAAHRVHP